MKGKLGHVFIADQDLCQGVADGILPQSNSAVLSQRALTPILGRFWLIRVFKIFSSSVEILGREGCEAREPALGFDGGSWKYDAPLALSIRCAATQTSGLSQRTVPGGP